VRPPVALNAIHARSADQAPGIVTEGRDTAMSIREEAWLGGAERAIEPGARNARAQEIILCISFDCGELAAQRGDQKFQALHLLRSSTDACRERQSMPGNGKVAIEDEAPWSDILTDYDQAHVVTYARLLDAADDGAKDDDIARIVLSLDPAAEPERAKRCLASHMRRARWISEHGYRHLLRHG
jgi:hypothetical protein